MKNEEKKVNEDFDKLVELFRTDINSLKNTIKKKLNHYLQLFTDMSEVMRTKANEYYSDKMNSGKYQNDFDHFLDNLQCAGPSYNIKKILTNISPILNKTNSYF